MSFRVVTSRSSGIRPLLAVTKSRSSPNQFVSCHKYSHGNSGREGSGHTNNWIPSYTFGVAGGVAALVLRNFIDDNQDILAEGKEETHLSQEVINQENR